MDDFTEEITKGFLRIIGYILAEIFFGTICYWVGWPICKIITLGKYPSSNRMVYLEEERGKSSNDFWCSGLGLIIIIFLSLFVTGQFS